MEDKIVDSIKVESSERLYNSIARINIFNKENEENFIGIGFFIKITTKVNTKLFFMTHSHILPKDLVNAKSNIILDYTESNQEKRIII